MVKKTKSKKTGTAKASVTRKVTRPTTRGTASSKYDQPGAPWWKKGAAPKPKHF